MKKIKISFITIFIFLLSPSPALAQVVINEVYPAPSNGGEWVEIYNQSGEEVDLTNWSLWDVLSSPTSIFSFTDQAIAAGSFLVIDLPSAKLNNNGDGVTLKNSNGELIDEMSYSSTVTDQSWGRVPDKTGEFQLTPPSRGEANVLPSPSPSPTPTPQPSPTPSPSPSPVTNPTWPITLLEIMACPVSGGEEWVKLYNPDSEAHFLENWRLRDESGQTRIVTIDIPAQGTSQISWSNSLLNNSGDTIQLENPSGQVIDSASYTQCQTGLTQKKINGVWTFAKTNWDENLLNSNSDELANPSSTPTMMTTTSPRPRLTPQSSLPTSHQPDLSGLVLGTISTPPEQDIITFPPPRFSQTGFISVILGGLIWCGVGLNGLIHQMKVVATQ